MPELMKLMNSHLEKQIYYSPRNAVLHENNMTPKIQV